MKTISGTSQLNCCNQIQGETVNISREKHKGNRITHRGTVVQMIADLHLKIAESQLSSRKERKNTNSEFYIHSKYPSNMKAKYILR